MSAFGDLLREIRHARGVNQRDLAEAVGVDFTYLSKIENGAMAAPSEEVIRKIAEHLGSDPEWLLAMSAKVPQDWGDVLENNPYLVRLLRLLAAKRYPEATYEHLLTILK